MRGICHNIVLVLATNVLTGTIFADYHHLNPLTRTILLTALQSLNAKSAHTHNIAKCSLQIC